MSDKKQKPATIADRIAALEHRVSAIERQIKPTPTPQAPKPWWLAYYPRMKERK